MPISRRALLLYVLWLGIAVWTLYAAARFHALGHDENELAVLQMRDADLVKRVETLEHLDLPPLPTVRITEPMKLVEPAWNKNAAADIRARLSALERWRIEQETKR